MSVTIVPYAIAAVRTSVQRVLAQRNRAVPSHPFESAQDFRAYWDEALSRHGSDDLALCVANELPVGGFGRTSYAFASAATIGEALRVFCRDSQRGVVGLTAQLDVIRARAELSLRGPDLLWPIFEILLAVLALRCRQLAEPPVDIVGVEIPRSEPSDLEPWRRVFGVRPKFGVDHGALVVAASALERPLRTSDSLVRDALGTGAMESIVDQVTAHLRAWVREAPDADQVSRSLGMSTRTLQRRLSDEGVTFRQLVLTVKLEAAKQLLDREHLSISEVADAVGFSRVAAFSRAFAQYAGETPSSFRARKKP